MWRALFGGPKGSPAAPSPEKPPADKFTLKHLHSLHATLLREKAAGPSLSSDARLIDAVKQLSEMMVYGDKHDEKFFE